MPVNFAYTGERLNWSLAEFAKNPLISLGMLWQTYPVVWAAVGLMAAGYAFYKLFGAIYRLCAWLRPAVRKTVTKAVWAVVWVLLCAWGIYGSATHYPLRWSEAYFSKDKNVNSLSLNPVLFFFSSFYLGRYFCGYGVFRQIFAFDDTLFGYDRGSAFRPRFGR